ncbi:MAG: hypothetical protein JO372_17485 [Solirubrobacterales bacterium]|nr:hypothetical protein [Solirubrobacterales bacterium]
MSDHEASRTLVKSLPELWTECSDAASLGRHLDGSFGEIKITSLDPETAVAWEGEHVSGTVRLEPSGWGTRVVLTARANGVASPAAGLVSSDAGEAPGGATGEAPDAGEAPGAGEAVGSDAGEPVASGAGEAPGAATGDAPGAVATETPPLLDAQPQQAPVAVPVLGRRRRGFMARMRGWLAGGRQSAAAAGRAADAAPAFASEPAPAPPLEPAPAPSVDPAPVLDPEAVLGAALDSLGQAHHRPFSRA